MVGKQGFYEESRINGIPQNYLDRFFTKTANGYQVKDELKNKVRFDYHNLKNDSGLRNLDIVFCRNVLIYFTEEAKDEVFRKFNASLKKDGILFIGSTEQIMNYKEINYERKNSFFYVKAK